MQLPYNNIIADLKDQISTLFSKLNDIPAGTGHQSSPNLISSGSASAAPPIQVQTNHSMLRMHLQWLPSMTQLMLYYSVLMNAL